MKNFEFIFWLNAILESWRALIPENLLSFIPITSNLYLPNTSWEKAGISRRERDLQQQRKYLPLWSLRIYSETGWPVGVKASQWLRTLRGWWTRWGSPRGISPQRKTPSPPQCPPASPRPPPACRPARTRRGRGGRGSPWPRRGRSWNIDLMKHKNYKDTNHTITIHQITSSHWGDHRAKFWSSS